MKKYIALSIVILSLVFLTGCKLTKTASNPSNNAGSSSGSAASEPAGTSTAAITGSTFFDDSSPVSLFYSDTCGWCEKEKVILDDLSKDGYRVKSMDVGTNKDYWTKYSIDGTPTFIAANGDKLVGYKEKVDLQPWLDSHGAKIK